jgi:hypothetical protein
MIRALYVTASFIMLLLKTPYWIALDARYGGVRDACAMYRNIIKGAWWAVCEEWKECGHDADNRG